MALDPTLNTAMQGQSLRWFTAFQIALPLTDTYAAYNINLIDGAGTVTFPVNTVSTTFTGTDPVFGSIYNFSQVSASVASESPHVTIALLPPSEVAIGQLNQPKYQGARTKIWIGLVDVTTGAVIGVPKLIFAGFLDVAKTTANQNQQVIELDIASGFERMFAANEGDRLTSVFHNTIHPGETGFDLNNDALTDPMWGAEGTTGVSAMSYDWAKQFFPGKFAANIK
jgi:hypothetical protein